VDITAFIGDFKQKFPDPLLEDITGTLEVTCHNSGEENHGSNFIVNKAEFLSLAGKNGKLQMQFLENYKKGSAVYDFVAKSATAPHPG
jgi:hypothetical protein